MNTNHNSLSDQAFLDKVKVWLESDGEVYVSYGYWRSGGADGELLIRSFDELRKIVAEFQNRKGGIEVYRYPRFLLRGIANEELLSKALEMIPDEIDWYLFYSAPSHASISIGTGDNSHAALRETFERFAGQEIALGLDIDFPPQEHTEGQDYLSFSNLG